MEALAAEKVNSTSEDSSQKYDSGDTGEERKGSEEVHNNLLDEPSGQPNIPSTDRNDRQGMIIKFKKLLLSYLSVN